MHICVCARESAFTQVPAHRHVHVSVCGGACTWACICGHERACGQVHAHGSVPVCRCVCVRVKESTVELHSHGHVCLCACLHRWLHMGVGWPGPGGMISEMWSLPCLPAWGGKQGLLLDTLGMAWGWAAWGSRHTDCRDSSLWACPGPLRSTGGSGYTQGLGEGQCSPGHCPVSCPLPSLVPTPWLENPLSPQIQGQQHYPTPIARRGAGSACPGVGHPCPAFPPTQFLSILAPSQF